MLPSFVDFRFATSMKSSYVGFVRKAMPSFSFLVVQKLLWNI